MWCAATAQAAEPRGVPGDGGSPSVVVDPAGTAHIVWGIAEELIGYCALPRGARSCSTTARLALDARDGRPEILRRPQDGLLAVVVGRDDFDDDPDESVWAFASANGVTWSGPVRIGAGIGEFDSAVLTADGRAVDLLAADTGENLFQRVPLGGPPTASLLNLATTRLRGNRWRRPRGLFYEVTANTDRAALAEDGKGRLHAAIVGYAGGDKRSCIVYARTHKRRWFTRAVSLHQTSREAEAPGRVRLAVNAAARGVVAWSTSGAPSVARVQRLRAGRGVTRPRAHSRRGCPPFPR